MIAAPQIRGKSPPAPSNLRLIVPGSGQERLNVEFQNLVTAAGQRALPRDLRGSRRTAAHPARSRSRPASVAAALAARALRRTGARGSTLDRPGDGRSRRVVHRGLSARAELT